MAQPPISVQVDGLNAARRALAAIDKAAPKAITKAARKAARIVQQEARKRAPVFEGASRTPWRIKDSIKVSSTQRGAGIRFGGPKAPHAPVHEFGGTIRRAGSGLVTADVFERGQKVGTRTFAPNARARFAAAGSGDFRQARSNRGRTRIEAQPFLYPAIAAKRGKVLEVFTGEFDTLLREFPQL